MNLHRVSGHKRVERDAYQTIEPWVTEALLATYPIPRPVWEPAAGDGHMVKVLEERGHFVHAGDLVSGFDFLEAEESPWFQRSAIVTNPPFGSRGKLAEAFVQHALGLTEPRRGVVAMLLPADFDHASSRLPLFLHPAYCMRIVLLRRPKWFAGKHNPKTNFVWHVWDWHNRHAPIVTYAGGDA